MQLHELCALASPNIVQETPDFIPVGMEFEFERVREPIAVRGWSYTPDGSLRNNGLEYVLRVPDRSRERLVTHITNLLAVANDMNYAATVRTGIHVHVNAQEWTSEQLRSILIAYCLAEPALYAYCGEYRDQNPYCIPCYASSRDIVATFEALNAADKQALIQAQQILNHVNKYSGLYTGPLVRHGSIEFRQLLTTLDVERAIEWVDIIQAVCAYGLQRDLARALLTEDADELALNMVRSIPGLAPHVRALDEYEVSATVEPLIPWLITVVPPDGWLMINDTPAMEYDEPRREARPGDRIRMWRPTGLDEIMAQHREYTRHYGVEILHQDQDDEERDENGEIY